MVGRKRNPGNKRPPSWAGKSSSGTSRDENMEDPWQQFKFSALQLTRSLGPLLVQSWRQLSPKVMKFWRTLSPYVSRAGYGLKMAGMLISAFGVLVASSALRGFSSMYKVQTAAFMMVLWCTLLTLARRSGYLLFFLGLGSSTALAFFLSPLIALIVFGAISLLEGCYFGSTLWTLGVSAIAGGAFACGRVKEGTGLAMVYGAYCAYREGGVSVLLLCTSLSCLSSDLFTWSMDNRSNKDGWDTFEKRAKSSSGGVGGEPPSPGGSARRKGGASKAERGGVETPLGKASQQAERGGAGGDKGGGWKGSWFGRASEEPPTPPPPEPSKEDAADNLRGSSGASISGRSEGGQADEEIARIQECEDHYVVLNAERFESVDDVSLKKEYRRIAMLVHPDKNRGNEQAGEAFKRLQNAYEVLTDAAQKKEYDDELARQDLLRQFRRSGHSRAAGDAYGGEEEGEPDAADMPDDARGRCKEYHGAKEGDGWVEQTSEASLFGLFTTYGKKKGFACSDGQIWDITDWFKCQGMDDCEPNSHKPTFMTRSSMGQPPGSSGAAGGTGGKKGKGGGAGAKGRSSKPKPGPSKAPPGMPSEAELDGMTEEELVDLVADLMASGAFDAEFLASMREKYERAEGGGGGGRTPRKDSAKKRRKSRRTEF
eukprot:jgi/Mesen1/2092/ME000151S01349